MKVSIVVPVYNNEPYLKKCMQSLLDQSYEDIEIIVIDDGSTDSSGAILDDFAKKDSRINLIHQENSGVSAARNKGVLQASGEYLTFVDGDDYVSSDYIRDFVACAKENDADMVIGGLCMVDAGGKLLEQIVPDSYERFEHEEWPMRITTVAVHFYKKSLWDKYEVTFFEGERGEDIPIAMFFAAVCETIAVLPKAGYYYVQHVDSAVHNFKGLADYKLPYGAMEQAIEKLGAVGINNGKDFHELFVLKILATFIQLAKGAGREEIDRLADYMQHILKDYYPDYYKNKRAKLFSDTRLPVLQKLAISTLVRVNRMGIVRGFLRFFCR